MLAWNFFRPKARALAAAVLMICSIFATPPDSANAVANGPVNCSSGGGTFTIQDNVVVSSTSNCSGQVIIPAGVTAIGNSAFEDISGLTSVEFESGSILETIGNYAFSNTGITAMVVPNTVTSIGRGAFSFSYYMTSITLPPGITAIAPATFYGATVLSSITIPENVTTIGESAFQQASSLTTVSISRNVTTIEDFAFSYATSLNSITVDSRNSNYSSIQGVLFNKLMTTLLLYPLGKTATHYTVPSGVTSIAANSFQGQTILTEITMPGSVTSIGDFAFGEAASLSAVNFNNAGLTSIGEYAFSDTSIQSIRIPRTVDSIGRNAFRFSSSLLNVLFVGDAPASVGLRAFDNIASGAKALISQTATGFGSTWNGLAVETPATTTAACDTGTITITAGIVTGHSGCTGQVNIPDGVTRIDEQVFYLSLITGVSFPSSLRSIGEGAFYAANSLTSINIPQAVTSIGDYALNAESLTSINVAANNPSYASVDGVLFDKSTTILVAYPADKTGSTYTIPNGVTVVGANAFALVNRLATVTFPSTVAILGEYAFYEAASISSVNLGTSITSIAKEAFWGTSITSITIPASVNTIGGSAFYSQSPLETVTFSGNAPPNVASNSFNFLAVGAQALIQSDATGFGSIGGTWNGLRVVAIGNENRNQNSSRETPRQNPTIKQENQQLVSSQGRTFRLQGENLGDIFMIKISGKEVKILKKQIGEIEIELPAGLVGYPDVEVSFPSGVVTVQGLFKVVQPYGQKRTQTVTSFAGNQPTQTSLAALKKSYLKSRTANILICSAKVASDASTGSVTTAKARAKATCQSVRKFAKTIKYSDVQVKMSGKAGSKPVLAVTFDRTLSGK